MFRRNHKKNEAKEEIIVPPTTSYGLKLCYPLRDWTIHFNSESERDHVFDTIETALSLKDGLNTHITVQNMIFNLSAVEIIKKVEE